MADNYQRPNYRFVGRLDTYANELNRAPKLVECSMCFSLVRQLDGCIEQHTQMHCDMQELMSSVLALQSAASGHAHRLPDHIHEYSGSVTSEEMA